MGTLTDRGIVERVTADIDPQKGTVQQTFQMATEHQIKVGITERPRQRILLRRHRQKALEVADRRSVILASTTVFRPIYVIGTLLVGHGKERIDAWELNNDSRAPHEVIGRFKNAILVDIHYDWLAKHCSGSSFFGRELNLTREQKGRCAG